MSDFSQLLNSYIDQLHCSAVELSKYSSISPATISRYRNGSRIPDLEDLSQLAEGLYNISVDKKLSLDQSEIFESLQGTLPQVAFDKELFHSCFHLLTETLEFNMSDLAKSMNYDASYLSRIHSGQRTPANIERFLVSLSHFIFSEYSTQENHMIALCSLISADTPLLSQEDLYQGLSRWFFDKSPGSSSEAPTEEMGQFLNHLDSFDLDEYIRSIHFDELKVPSVPFLLPASKHYYGLEQMKQGELDFFKSTILSKSKETIFMCSDMPMADMAKDLDFGKKWMFAVAVAIKKGLHIHMIHNIDRPFHEMMLGLESWIPIYMTGQVSPYHLPSHKANTYHHLNYVSGSVALTGECIHGHHNDGKYYLTNNKEEVAYAKKKAKHILGKAQPLMEIYTKANQEAFYTFSKTKSVECGQYHHMLSSLPLYTISEELLLRILQRVQLEDSLTQVILSYAREKRQLITQLLGESQLWDEVFYLSEAEFYSNPMYLDLSELFTELQIAYTYEEYRQHLWNTEEFAKMHTNYRFSQSSKLSFRNIQIYIFEENYVQISKIKSPTIHFVIRHPKMVSALQHYIPPIA